jgi:hypothetical protein
LIAATGFAPDWLVTGQLGKPAYDDLKTRLIR